MAKPGLRVIDSERQHPRDLARQRVAEWRSNAERQSLPVVNVRDTGAPLLQVDAVLGHADHDARLGRK